MQKLIDGRRYQVDIDFGWRPFFKFDFLIFDQTGIAWVFVIKNMRIKDKICELISADLTSLMSTDFVSNGCQLGNIVIAN